MDEKTSHALELSITKWKSIASFGGEDHADRNCELCKVFAVGTNDCRGCPVRDEVFERTGNDHMEASCGQTPFGKWAAHHRTEHSHSIPRKVLCEGCSSIAFDEVRYLCGLREKEEKMITPRRRPPMSPLRARTLKDIDNAFDTHLRSRNHPSEQDMDDRIQKAMETHTHLTPDQIRRVVDDAQRPKPKKHSDYEPHAHEGYVSTTRAEEIASELIIEHMKYFHKDSDASDHPITTSQVEAIAQRVMSLAFNTHRLDHHPDEKFSSAPLARAGHIWCDDEDRALDNAVIEFITRRASKHQRTESAIASRIGQKDLLAKHI